MIELISASRCTGCNICVAVCPTSVFDAVPDAAPAIAHQHDCQTCFMCELYCPADALYVAPAADRRAAVDEHALVRTDLLGSYRRSTGWRAGQTTAAARDASHELLTR